MYERPAFSGSTLVAKPSTVFSTTSTASSGSSGARLLFGEIDASSLTSSSTTFNTCTVVQSTNATFLRFWHSEGCREKFLTFLDQRDLAILRLVSLDLCTRLAPRCFEDISCFFNANSFKRSRIQALERIGRHVQTFRLVLPYTFEHVLPPLIDTETGEEKNFTYTPVRPTASASSQSKVMEPKYGDWETTDLLVRQYPPLFHAAANSVSFVQAMSALSNMTHLVVQGESDGFHARSHHRNVSDFALVSLRAALESAPIQTLSRVSLSDLPTSAMKYLKPTSLLPDKTGIYDWCSQVDFIDASMKCMENKSKDASEQLLVVQDYLRNFRNIERLSFSWVGRAGPYPFSPQTRRDLRPSKSFRGARRPSHPALRQQPTQPSIPQASEPVIRFPRLVSLSLHNMTASVGQVQSLLRDNRAIRDLDFEDVELECGTWDEALRPLSGPRQAVSETGDVPIMLAKQDDPTQQKPTLSRQDSGISGISSPSSPNRTPERREPEDKAMRKVCFVEERHGCALETSVDVRSLHHRSHQKKRRDVFNGACGELRRIFRGGLLRWP
ncbi:hypothetical protein KVT40_002296 [Elsinoe batatas]|uniref:Uncharacterized protein n=1 Tax=Elsinoe batatas TaxID=2601811 RepID=A0A8K0PJM2_9PEZI|nr:hypothetical protein KVT40_002296 [Elsinoe batatas]